MKSCLGFAKRAVPDANKRWPRFGPLQTLQILLLTLLTIGHAATGYAEQSDPSASGGADVAGYYTYSDPELGQFDLALLPDHQFLLVIRPPGSPAEGVEGLFLQQDSQLFFSNGGFEARGVLEGDILRLATGDTTIPFLRAGPSLEMPGADSANTKGTRITDAAPADLPITVWYWIAAATPLMLLIVLLAGFHWEPAPAAALALASAVVVAMALYQLPLQGLAVATGKAVWDAVFVMYIIWPALVLYSVIKEADAFNRIEEAMQSLIRSRLLLMLAVAWAFSSFIQGIVGEGVPLAITIPLMLQLGVRPIYAVLLPLIGRTWGNVFGSMGEGWLIVERIADVQEPVLTALYSGFLLAIPNVLAGLGIAWFYGRWWAVKHGAMAIVVIALVHSGVQLGLAVFYPRIAGFAAGSAGLIAVFLLAKWGPYTQKDEEEPDRIFKNSDESTSNGSEDSREGNDSAPDKSGEMPLWAAFAPYVTLAILALVLLVIPPVRGYLEQFSIGLDFPATSTGLGVQKPAESAYGAFQVFIHPGTLIIVATVLTAVIYEFRGYFVRGSTMRIFKRAIHEALPASTPFVSLVLSAKVLEVSGMMLVLGLGTALITTPAIYTFLSPFIGAIGAFATSSTSGSLVLFTPLQVTAAHALGIPVSIAAAGQAAGAAAGNALAALDILIGLLVIGKPKLLGPVLRKTSLWAVVALSLIGAAALAFYLIGALR